MKKRIIVLILIALIMTGVAYAAGWEQIWNARTVRVDLYRYEPTNVSAYGFGYVPEGGTQVWNQDGFSCGSSLSYRVQVFRNYNGQLQAKGFCTLMTPTPAPTLGR